jgi:CheY-like chemotaxis protein
MNTQKGSSAKKQILLAEDDASVRRYLEVILKRAGYEVHSAEDGLEAMQASLTSNFDAVVTDAVMPNMTGYDLCRLLKSNPQFDKTPIVILSGLETETDDSQIADCFLLKTANLNDELLRVLSGFFHVPPD